MRTIDINHQLLPFLLKFYLINWKIKNIFALAYCEQLHEILNLQMLELQTLANDCHDLPKQTLELCLEIKKKNVSDLLCPLCAPLIKIFMTAA